MSVEIVPGESINAIERDGKVTIHFTGNAPRSYAVRKDSHGLIEVAKQTPGFYQADARDDLRAELTRLRALGFRFSEAFPA